MFLTKKHVSRRTVLRGAGAMLSLPLLDAMVPAATVLAQTAASRRPRFVGLFVPHGMAPGILGAREGGRTPGGTALQLEAARAVREADA